MSTTTPLVDAAVDDTALEDKNQPHTDWITAHAGREIEAKLNEATAVLEKYRPMAFQIRDALRCGHVDDVVIEVQRLVTKYGDAMGRIATLERELNEAKDRLDTILEVIPEDAPCQFIATGETVADYILDLQREVEKVHKLYFESHAREAQLRAAFRMSLIRAYTAGNFHGHHTTVDGGYVDVHHSDITTYWAESIDEMLNDGSLPEAQSALSAFTAKHEL